MLDHLLLPMASHERIDLAIKSLAVALQLAILASLGIGIVICETFILAV